MTFWFFCALMILFYAWISWLFAPHHKIEILWESPKSPMANPIVGQPSAFTVIGRGSKGSVLPLVDPVTVSVDNGTATVNPDGTGGVFTPAVAGPFTLSANSGAFTTSFSGAVDDVPEVLTGIEIQFA